MTKLDKISLAVGIGGLVSLVAGVCLVSIPAGCVTAGICLIAYSYLLARTSAKS